MARLASILRGLARAVWREQQSLGSIAANNFFVAVALLMPVAGVFLLTVIGLLLLLPLSADPMRKLPKERLTLWPLSRRDFAILRFASIWLSPATWLVMGLLFWASTKFRLLGYQLLGVVVLANLAGAAAGYLVDRRPGLSIFRHVPSIPGPLGELVRKNLREILSVLDPYLAFLVAIATVLYRTLAEHPEPEATFAMSMMVVLAMSTYAQKLFSLDLAGGQFLRYRLMPLRGWKILLAKDLAFLLITLALALPLNPLPAAAAVFATLIVGHHASVLRPLQQARWRFTGGTVAPDGILQVVFLFGAGTLVQRQSAAFLIPILIAWLASLYIYGRRLERTV